LSLDDQYNSADNYDNLLSTNTQELATFACTESDHGSPIIINSISTSNGGYDYCYQINENVEPGTIITNAITTVDQDMPQQEMSFYTISNGDITSNLFAIDQNTGRVTVGLFPIDFESSYIPNVIEIDIYATDNGNPNLKSSVRKIGIFIKDVNEPPEFKSTNYFFQIDENKPVGTVVSIYAQPNIDRQVQTTATPYISYKSGKVQNFVSNNISLADIVNKVINAETNVGKQYCQKKRFASN